MTYRRKDAFHRRAKAEGYRARSAYKLAELDRRYRLLRRGDRVVDLGAWPGGWLQVAAERVGPEGRIVGVDLVPLEPLAPPTVTLLTGDLRDPATAAEARARLGRPADVVLSDVAPKLTGVRATDEARSSELFEGVLAALPTLLAPGGRLLAKLFMTNDYERLVGEVRRRFATTTTTRTEASRRGSAELYVVALGYSGAPAGG
ncbi:MAG TPA: RlmE family RNA methyltransferase [Candidatus Binatia bacterium]|nr:RlmE family RNA methyltransferase [Candidatus Binatia bacterium]